VYPQNLAFHKNAFALVMVPMVSPPGAVDVSRSMPHVRFSRSTFLRQAPRERGFLCARVNRDPTAWLGIGDRIDGEEPRSKFDRMVFTERLVEAGLTLVAEAEAFGHNDLARARGMRNGVMLALLAFCPIRLKNFAALGIGQTFKEIHGRWWIVLPGISTKSRRPDERPVPAQLNRCIDVYLSQSRPVLLGSRPPTNALWISSTTGKPMTTKNLGTLISKITFETLGVDVSSHLFRTAAASTAAAYGGKTPHLASALLHHTDPRVTEEHYNRASSVSAAAAYARIISEFRTR
jgi:integrase